MMLIFFFYLVWIHNKYTSNFAQWLHKHSDITNNAQCSAYMFCNKRPHYYISNNETEYLYATRFEAVEACMGGA
jgi:Ni,Fe-hydrogenase I cytochrome b subunit